MNDWGEATAESAVQQNEGGRKTITVSARKIAANRKNALKSTGPRTRRGKMYSRKNALKHGLFTMDLFTDFLATREQPEKFQALLTHLRRYYRPLGLAEELEVERIAVCWWKHNRAWRYENAQILCGLIEVAATEQDVKARKMMLPEHRAILQTLESAEKEIEDTGGVSQELKHKMFATDPSFRHVWAKSERITKKKYAENLVQQTGMSLSDVRKYLRIASSVREIAARAVLAATAKLVKRYFESVAYEGLEFMGNVACDHKAILSDEALDRVLRVESATERSLSRAYDRLERLQRRRIGELIPPPLNVRLNR